MEKEEKILVAGATGASGLEIMKLLQNEQKSVRALTRSSSGVTKLKGLTDDIWKADAAKNPSEIENITKGVTTVVSVLGKSVSLFTPSDDSFFETDFQANKSILDDALRNDVKRFVYVSIKGADSKEDYSIAKAHKLFENELRASGLDYTIIRPVGFFSGLNDLAIMAKRKVIPIIGSGEARTNSIHHKDLAAVVVSYLNDGPEIIEVGGPNIHTRLEMAEMIEEIIGGKVIRVPETMAKLGAELPKIFSEGIHDKLDYFAYITTNDMIGEANGTVNFRTYLEGLDLKKLS